MNTFLCRVGTLLIVEITFKPELKPGQSLTQSVMMSVHVSWAICPVTKKWFLSIFATFQNISPNPEWVGTWNLKQPCWVITQWLIVVNVAINILSLTFRFVIYAAHLKVTNICYIREDNSSNNYQHHWLAVVMINLWIFSVLSCSMCLFIMYV